jgi:hypothetical protein
VDVFYFNLTVVGWGFAALVTLALLARKLISRTPVRYERTNS